MRIAQIAPLVESVPPTLYGGTERVVSWLAEELVALGHEVTLFASGNSATSGSLVPIVPRALRSAGIQNSTPYNIIMLDQVAARHHDFDVLHFHIDFFHYPLFCSTRQQDVNHTPWPPRPTRDARHISRISAHAVGLHL